MEEQPTKEEETMGIKIESDKPTNPEISLHALIGSQNPKTMRVMGKIGGY